MPLLDPDASPAPRSRGPLVVSAVLLLLAGGAWLAWRASRPVTTPRAPVAASPPSTASRPALAPGAVEVTADVAGATVRVDGRAAGAAPQHVAGLAPGQHVVRVEAAGRAPYEVEVHVVPGQVTRVAAKLRAGLAAPTPSAPAAPTTVGDELHVDSDVPGASVFVDRRLRGTTPLVLRDVPAGSHRVNVTAEGYEMQGLDVEVSGLTRVRVSFKEVRLDEAVEVQHRHGLGACEGRLVATPQGLRYEPSKSDHAFAVPLGALEKFEVDYLKKELRVKAARKSWTFTTRGRSADPLLSFQQRVDAARKRL